MLKIITLLLASSLLIGCASSPQSGSAKLPIMIGDKLVPANSLQFLRVRGGENCLFKVQQPEFLRFYLKIEAAMVNSVLFCISRIQKKIWIQMGTLKESSFFRAESFELESPQKGLGVLGISPPQKTTNLIRKLIEEKNTTARTAIVVHQDNGWPLVIGMNPDISFIFYVNEMAKKTEDLFYEELQAPTFMFGE